jgi:hypothetical protein
MKMADLKSIVQDNQKERERLLAFMAGLKEKDFKRRLPNGWSVSVALAHLAFWDFRQVTMLQRWLAEKKAPGTLDVLAINEPLSLLSEAIPGPVVVKFTKAAAEMSDQSVEALTQAQADEFLKVGTERFLHRAQHRREHLDKIVKALEGPAGKG